MTPRHTILALLVVVIWGVNFLAIDFGLAGVPPLVFLALRFLLVAIPAIFFIKPPGIGWRNVLLIGAFLSLGQFTLLYLALSLGMPPGLASLLLQTQVVLSVVVSAILLRERPTRRQLIGIAVGMVGLAVVVVGHSYAAPWLPVVILLGAALSWAIGNVLSRRAKVASGLSLVVWSGLIVPIPSLALSLVVDSPPVVWQALTHLSWVAIASTVYTAVAASLVGYGIWNTLLAKYPTSAVVPFTLLVPVVGIVAAWIAVNEQPTLSELVGGTVMLVGLGIAVIMQAPWKVRQQGRFLVTDSLLDPTIWRIAGAPLVAGDPAGLLLAGETVAVKDLYEIEGFAVGAGVPEFLAAAKPASGTSPAVIALLEAGAAITGLAQTDEFAYSIAGRNPHYGTPPNPAVPGGVPGGSSSGPASAVATGQASIGLGTDTAGSIRVPASYQGLWGLRTTHGAVSADRLLPLAPTFDSVGWITRNSGVLRRAAEATLDSAPQREVEPVFAVAPGLGAHVEPDVRDAFEAFVGDRYESVDLGDIDELFVTFRTVQQAEAWATHGAWILAHPDALGPDVAARFAAASAVTAEQAAAAREALGAARARLHAVLGDRVLLLPAASSSAPSVMADADLVERTRQGTLRLTCIAGITGRPGLSVPLLGVPRPGAPDAPLGLSLVGPRLGDLALIELGESLVGEPS